MMFNLVTITTNYFLSLKLIYILGFSCGELEVVKILIDFNLISFFPYRKY